jgi:hypothetical protein
MQFVTRSGGRPSWREEERILSPERLSLSLSLSRCKQKVRNFAPIKVANGLRSHHKRNIKYL